MAHKTDVIVTIPSDLAAEAEAVLAAFGPVRREQVRSIGLVDVTAIVTLIGAAATSARAIVGLVKELRSFLAATDQKGAAIQIKLHSRALTLNSASSDEDIEKWTAGS